MATSFIFNGKKISLPGVYSAIKSGIKNPPPGLDFGKVLIIDTGSGAGYGFGSGIFGTLKEGADAVYQGITDQGTMKTLMKGGVWWKMAEPLFKPDGADSIGASEVEWVRAATTTPAVIDYAFAFGITNTQTLVTATTVAPGVGIAQVNTITVGAAVDKGDIFTVTLGSAVAHTAVLGDTNITVATALKVLIDASVAFSAVTCTRVGAVLTLTANATNTPFTQTSGTTNTSATAGSLEIKMRDEGLCGNGVASGGTLLTKGYGATFEAGTTDTDKYMFKFWLGQYRGMDPINGVPFDRILDVNTNPELVVQSPEFAKLSEAVTWMTNDYTFNLFFKLTASTVGSDDFVPADLIDSGDLNLAAGGTETYSNAAFDEVLNHISDDDYSFILSDKANADAEHLYNEKFVTFMAEESKFDRFLMIGGGNDKSEFQTVSVAAAVAYNNDDVYVVHGAPRVAAKKFPGGFLVYDSLYKTAQVTGRAAGLQPQVPLTFKSLGYAGEEHMLTKKEQAIALQYGVLYTIFDKDLKKFTVGQGINTLQSNENQINDDGTTYSMQLKRIAAQMNKEIVINAKKQLFANPNGVNQNTLSVQNVKDWLIGYLRAKLATQITDNLIISFDSASVTVTRDQDAYFCTYKFAPNGEITKMFVTGFMIN